jgi:hypothetical protein
MLIQGNCCGAWTFSHAGAEDGQIGRAIPSSSLANDTANNVLRAGVGHVWDQCTQHFYPNITTGLIPFSQSPWAQSALCRMNLN